jgi:hypothetical protein
MDGYDFVLIYIFGLVFVRFVDRLGRPPQQTIAVDRFDVDAAAGPLVAIEGRLAGLNEELKTLRGADPRVALTVTRDRVTLRRISRPDREVAIAASRIADIQWTAVRRSEHIAPLAVLAYCAVCAALGWASAARIGATLAGVGLYGALELSDRIAARLHVGTGERAIGVGLAPGAVRRADVIERSRAAFDRITAISGMGDRTRTAAAGHR